jgi:mannose/fructose/N-acetylgalactosamine-specific phosphotransferase system component IIB
MYLRVDDRLVHGQVVTAWLKQLKAKVIIAVDDIAAQNAIVVKALKMATPKNVELVVATVEEGKSVLTKYNENEVMLIVKAPVTAKILVDANSGYQWTVNVGNVGMDSGRKKYAQTVHLDEENYQAVVALKEYSNVNIFMQTVPGQSINKF